MKNNNINNNNYLQTSPVRSYDNIEENKRNIYK